MKNLALVFPGQGSQYVGMGKGLFEKSNIAKRVFEEASDSIGIDIKKMCFEGSLEELSRTENTQPAILTLSVAAFRTYMEKFGEIPAFSVGHSLGEISALTCAGAIEFLDAVKIVRQRGKFMQESSAVGTGCMYAISEIDINYIAEECRKNCIADLIVGISNYNSPQQTVISGHRIAVERVVEQLSLKGATTIGLKVSAPFHSSLMQPASIKLKEELLKYSFNKFNWPVISNVTALPYSTPEEIIENLTKQMVSPVMWQTSVEFLKNIGVTMAVELGPKKVLKNLVQSCTKEITVYSYDDDNDIELLKSFFLNNLAKAGPGFKSTVITKCITTAICTKNRNWDNEAYNKGVVEPYKKVKKLQADLEKEGKDPTLEQMQEALYMLKSVFVTKKVGIDEQVERFNQIFDTAEIHHLFPNFIKSLG
ncbi:MAG: [acyl-carrier-protein] S-malonyltransferase [Firmicutes bacterium HGW-Firmicutes-7]|nr:MAG: [acyl-carrier-protein] S-malonyltransferase [Firmicutes bacterium HGW-Firmicutes-7]